MRRLVETNGELPDAVTGWGQHMGEEVEVELETHAEEPAARIDNLEEEEALPFVYSITSYGADYPVDGLVQRLQDESIEIPEFQRGFVWNRRRASRFIESLLLGLPVPGIFLSKDPETQKLLVIDGQQRLRTLQYFYQGVFAASGREFSLRYIESDFSGATYRSLADSARRRLNDSIIHATIIRQDEPSDDQSSVYSVFERLNTESDQLKPQEIRSCIFHGPFNDLLKALNANTDWRRLFGPLDKRMRDQELILRFLAMHFIGSQYKRPLKGFLNDYMGSNRHLELQSAETIGGLFEETVRHAYASLGPAAFRPRRNLNAAVVDSVLTGIAARLEAGLGMEADALKTAYRALMSNEDYLSAIERSTADEEQVRTRLDAALSAFSE